MAAISGGEWQKRYMRIDEAKGGVAYSKTSKYVLPSLVFSSWR